MGRRNSRCIAALIAGVMICTLSLAQESPAQAPSAASPAETRPDTWAQPVELEGVPNLHKVSDTLYRSAQPTAEGMKNLKELGIATIINLRSFHSDRDEIGETGLRYEHIYMKPWHPEDKEVVRFLQLVANPDNTPVLVHCMHGADRTGMMCAVYRVAIEGWTKEDALEEMKEGGFGFHRAWDNLVKWFENLDMDEMKRRAGLAEEAPTP